MNVPVAPKIWPPAFPLFSLNSHAHYHCALGANCVHCLELSCLLSAIGIESAVLFPEKLPLVALYASHLPCLSQLCAPEESLSNLLKPYKPAPDPQPPFISNCHSNK